MKKKILPLLAASALVYQTGQTPEELALLADIFAEDLAGENFESINRAFSLHRRRSSRFPTPAHIIAILPECRVLPKREALPQASAKKTEGMGNLVLLAIKGNAQAKDTLKLIMTKACGAASA